MAENCTFFNYTFGGRILEIFSVLQTKLAWFALMGEEPKGYIVRFAKKFKAMVRSYLDKRDDESKMFLIKCADNAESIRLLNPDVIESLLNIGENQNEQRTMHSPN